MAGTTSWGGVLAVAGDDHVVKSSTAAHQSDRMFKACGTPVFSPSNLQEILDLGLRAIALSHFSGVWSGMTHFYCAVANRCGGRMHCSSTMQVRYRTAPIVFHEARTAVFQT